MNKFTVNFDICKELGITPGEFLYLTSLYIDQKIGKQTLQNCYDKHLLTYRTMEQSRVGPHVAELSEAGITLVEDVITTSEAQDNGYTDQRIIALATKLKEIYPKGKKPNSNYYWADGAALIARRLKLFFKKYGMAYSEEDIIDATQRYVKDFTNNKYMKLLKYFIFKEATGAGGDIEPTSDLLNYIENKDQESATIATSENWMEEIR